jgi:AcrR family transcriptional regulator
MNAQPDDTATAARRPRGRPRKSASPVDTRALIVKAAGAEFAATGYDATSVRAVARRAGVDASLVHHYFESKADLFVATVRVPVRPDRLVAQVLAGPRDRIGVSLVRAVVVTLDDAKTNRRVIRLLHTALGQEFAATLLRQFVSHEILGRITAALGGDDPELRASFAASQMVGLIVARYGVRIEPLASATPDEVARTVGPVVQWYLTGEHPLDTGATAGE